MNDKHFELTGETIEYCGHTLHRIRATRDIPECDIKKGDIGGFVESYDNLSDNAWVYDNAKVFCSAEVYENAGVFGNARVYGNALVYGDAQVLDNALVYGDAQVFGNAGVYSNAQVFGHAKVYEHARVAGDALVDGAAEVYGNAEVFGDVYVYGNTEVFGNARVGDMSRIFEYAQVLGDAIVCGYAHIGGTAVVKSTKDYIVFKNFWSSGRHFTWTRSNNMWSVGCFYGTGEELIAKAYKDSEESGKLYEYTVKSVNEMNKLLKKGE